MVCVEQKAHQLVFPEIRFQSGSPIQDLVIDELRGSHEFLFLPSNLSSKYTQSSRLISDTLFAPVEYCSPADFTFERHAELLDRVVEIIQGGLGIGVEDSTSWDTGISKGNTPKSRAIRVRVDPSVSRHYPFGPVILGQVISEADYLARSPDKKTAKTRIEDGWTLLESRLWVVSGLSLAHDLLRNASPIDGVSFRQLTEQRIRFTQQAGGWSVYPR